MEENGQKIDEIEEGTIVHRIGQGSFQMPKERLSVVVCRFVCPFEELIEERTIDSQTPADKKQIEYVNPMQLLKDLECVRNRLHESPED